MKTIILTLDIIAFVCSLLWLICKPDFEPLITSIASLVVLLGILFIKPKKKKSNNITMSQKAGNNSRQYQSGNDMTVNNN
ncbi:MAG: hypothetical protein HY951_07005 [Bacteroidia bacterium]|nr:hypothetical protein [Bacteroidia bacterium]